MITNHLPMAEGNEGDGGYREGGGGTSPKGKRRSARTTRPVCSCLDKQPNEGRGHMRGRELLALSSSFSLLLQF